MLLALFAFQVTFIDYHGHEIEADIAFPEKKLWSHSRHVFYGTINGHHGLCKLHVMSGNILVSDENYGGWVTQNSSFYVTRISIRDSTPFHIAKNVADRLFDYCQPIEYTGGKYVFERRFWSWEDVKASWANVESLLSSLVW